MKRGFYFQFLLFAFSVVWCNLAMADQLILEKVDCKYDRATNTISATAVVSGDYSKIKEPRLIVSWNIKNFRGDITTPEAKHKLTKMEGKTLIFNWKAKAGSNDNRRGNFSIEYENETGKTEKTKTKTGEWMSVTN